MLTSPFLISKKGFTLVELIIGMTIFAVGMSAILALLGSAIDTSINSRQEISASNLLREQIELIKNVRNTNKRNFVSWDKIRTEGVASSSLTGGIYIVENDYTKNITTYANNGDILTSPIYIKDITPSLSTPNTLEQKYTKTHLYIDNQGRYTHTITPTPTNLASYVSVIPLGFRDTSGNLIEPIKDGKYQGFILDARVIAKSRFGYREYDLKTVMTDWNK